jgi:hypothetical protein
MALDQRLITKCSAARTTCAYVKEVPLRHWSGGVVKRRNDVASINKSMRGIASWRLMARSGLNAFGAPRLGVKRGGATRPLMSGRGADQEGHVLHGHILRVARTQIFGWSYEGVRRYHRHCSHRLFIELTWPCKASGGPTIRSQQALVEKNRRPCFAARTAVRGDGRQFGAFQDAILR